LTGAPTGQALPRRLRGRVTGLAGPTYVPGSRRRRRKVPIRPDYLEGERMVRDPAGITHAVRRGA
jgi:lysine 2,3-aminomutase